MLCVTLSIFILQMCSLLPGSASGKSIPLKAMPLPPPQSSAYSMPPPSANGKITPANGNHMLDYLESQVRGMDMTSPLLQVCPTSASHVFRFYLGFTRSLFFYYRVLLIASICPSGSTTSTKPHAADPTSLPTHACRHPIFPRSSQHDLCPR